MHAGRCMNGLFFPFVFFTAGFFGHLAYEYGLFGGLAGWLAGRG